MKCYIAIDLKSFYASVECKERGLDPLDTNLVVADKERTSKTICLAITPSLKSIGLPGRARLFEVEARVNGINAERKRHLYGKDFSGKSFSARELAQNPKLELDFIIAKPRMKFYIDYSRRIYSIYLRYVAPEDMHVYSIDEVFIDATAYLELNKMTAEEFARMIISDILKETGITATAGIGTNLYLCKIAMDIVAKHIPPDENGVRIACLDEKSYRHRLWAHTPLTDFWRVGKGYAKKLEENGIFTMGDIARCSLGKEKDFYNEELLYKLFGVNAELLIDHAWGYESATIADIKAYKPSKTSLGSSQVLSSPYKSDKARLIVKEMADSLALSLVSKGLKTNQIVMTISYDRINLTAPAMEGIYNGEVVLDSYGRKIPKHSHGTQNLNAYSSSSRELIDASVKLFDRINLDQLYIRKISLSANDLISSLEAEERKTYRQLSLFDDEASLEHSKDNKALEKEKEIQEAIINIKRKFGKNAILKGMNFEEGATGKNRNSQIGGHRE